MKPRTTFIEFSQLPDFGRPLNHEGNIERRVNGREKARENPNIPRIGFRASPPADSTSNAPTIGPVHEKDTSTNVNAIKKAPIYPPLSACLSDVFTHLPGRTSSNIPRNEAAKTMKRIKKIRFGIQCVLTAFVTSAPALVKDTIKPIKVYIRIIDKPKMSPIIIALILFLPSRMKKVTVIGIMGKTHGVRSAASPATKDIRKNTQIDLGL